MALVETKYCNHCEQIRDFTNFKCNNCADREYREKMAAWLAKTTDEKLLDIHKRLLYLERGPARY
jgi:DUF1680 family protein